MDVSELIRKAPQKPGVYLFKRGGRYIYIGKAKDLRRRLLQHLQLAQSDPKERAIVFGADGLEWIITRNEYEALVLEIDLIQQHKPRYNVLHKFGGGYPMLLLTGDKFPTLKVVRGTEHEGELFGPFLQVRKAYKVKRLIHELFKLRTCEEMPSDPEPCMDYHLGLCSAPCAGLVSEEDYRLAVESARALLTGDVSEVLPKLYGKIEEYSREMMFEKCAQLRDQIVALENIARGQAVSALPFREADILYLVGRRLGLFLVRASKLVNKEVITLEREDELEEVITGYYYSNYIPSLIVTNFELPEELRRWIRERARREVSFSSSLPRELEEIVEENVGEGDLSELEREFREKLGMGLPRIIEGFDISHFFGEDTVGSCVVWREGSMDKRSYRRYR
ncbi:MAG: GIY-YIG nuclease family protein, partial [Aquificae bacterium]|nr:GIY-YIG nuclease family protein [Aquificota bacterium]